MNPYAEFLALVPKSRTVVCTVVSESTGTTKVRTLDGQFLNVLGTGGRSAGAAVFVQDSRIIGDAPDLPVTSYTV